MIIYQRFMLGVHLKRSTYPISPYDDHEHCTMCGAKFSKHPDEIHEGYVTTDGQYWICDECLNEYKKEYGWVIENSSVPKTWCK